VRAGCPTARHRDLIREQREIGCRQNRLSRKNNDETHKAVLMDGSRFTGILNQHGDRT
jgi:hypothetical protein